jgi:serine/threonine-protein kinase OSR1/STK39
MANLDDAHKMHFSSNIDDYIIYGKIGAGAFSEVYKAYEKKLEKYVAIKIVDLEQSDTEYENMYNEIHIMQNIKHANLVHMHTSFCCKNKCYIIMPWMEYGSCANIISKIAPHGFKDEILIATILKYILEAIVYLHHDGHIHRDIKGGNILIDKDGHVQLGDFGIATTLLENGMRSKRTTFTGTPCWMAPEIVAGDKKEISYDEKVDIWSFGITAMELAYGKPPYIEYPPSKIFLMILSQDPPTCNIYNDNTYKFSNKFYKMISKCLEKNPEKRPTAKKLLESNFFSQAKDNTYIMKTICNIDVTHYLTTTENIGNDKKNIELTNLIFNDEHDDSDDETLS